MQLATFANLDMLLMKLDVWRQLAHLLIVWLVRQPNAKLVSLVSLSKVEFANRYVTIIFARPVSLREFVDNVLKEIMSIQKQDFVKEIVL